MDESLSDFIEKELLDLVNVDDQDQDQDRGDMLSYQQSILLNFNERNSMISRKVSITNTYESLEDYLNLVHSSTNETKYTFTSLTLDYQQLHSSNLQLSESLSVLINTIPKRVISSTSSDDNDGNNSIYAEVTDILNSLLDVIEENLTVSHIPISSTLLSNVLLIKTEVDFDSLPKVIENDDLVEESNSGSDRNNNNDNNKLDDSDLYPSYVLHDNYSYETIISSPIRENSEFNFDKDYNYLVTELHSHQRIESKNPVERLNQQIEIIRKEKSVISIQAYYRGYRQRIKYQALFHYHKMLWNKYSIIIQTYYRRYMARKYTSSLKHQKQKINSIIKLQSYYRMYRHQKDYQQQKEKQKLLLAMKILEQNRIKEEVLSMSSENIHLHPNHTNIDDISFICDETDIDMDMEYDMNNYTISDSQRNDSSHRIDDKEYQLPIISFDTFNNHISSLHCIWKETIENCLLLISKNVSTNDQTRQHIDKKSKRSLPKRNVTMLQYSIESWQNSVRKIQNTNIKSILYPQTIDITPNDNNNNKRKIHESTKYHLSKEEDEGEDMNIIEDLGLHFSHPMSIYTLELGVEGITSAFFVQKFPNLRKVSMNVNKLVDIKGFPSLQYLSSLSICDNRIQSLDGIQYLSNLKYLYADTNRITDISLLSNLSNLVIVSMNSNLITSIPTDFKLYHLQRLELSQNKITCIFYDHIKYLYSLTFLSLERNQITFIDSKVFYGILSNDVICLLQTLILSHNLLESLPYPIRLPMLRNLWMSGNRISSLSNWSSTVLNQGYENIHDSNNDDDNDSNNNSNIHQEPIFLPMLEKLYLQDNQITSLPLNLFPLLPKLYEFDLSFNKLSKHIDLIGLKDSLSLRHIQLQENPISIPLTELQQQQAIYQPGEEIGDHISDYKTRALFYCPSLLSISGEPIENSIRQQLIDSSHSVFNQIHRYMKSRQGYGRISKSRRVVRMNEIGENSLELYRHQFIEFMDSLIIAQNSFKSQELIDKRLSLKQIKSDIKIDQKYMVSNEFLLYEYWESSWIELLREQVRMMITFEYDGKNRLYCELGKYSIENMKSNDQIWIDSKQQWIDANKKEMEMENEKEKEKENDSSDTIQSIWRGYHIRRRLQIALSSVRYVDTELDDLLLNSDDNTLLEDISILSSLDQPFYPNKAVISSSSNSSSSSSSNESMKRSNGGTPPVAIVYGDHRRPRNTPTNTGSRSTGWTDVDGYRMVEIDETENTMMLSRPSTAQSEATSMSSLSATSVSDHHNHHRILDYDNTKDLQDEVSAIINQYQNNQIGSDSVNSNSSTSTSTSTSRDERYRQQLANEWGISDPKVIETLAKRNKKYKILEISKERREKDKDPVHRYQRFVKNSLKSGTGTGGINIEISGSFGGKPKQTRTIRQRGKISMPAWATGEDQTDST